MKNLKCDFHGACAVALGALAAVELAAFSIYSQAQSYSHKVIKVVVPVVAGGPPDAAARAVTQHMQERLGQAVVIENRPGAGTTIGTLSVSTAAADGHTLLFNGSNLLYFPVLYPNLEFDPARNLAPVATAVAWSHIMVMAPTVPVRTMAELVQYAKANPGKLNIGYGLGTTPHLLSASFVNAIGADITFVQYRGGDQARADLMSGRIHLNFGTVEGVLSLLRQGKARPLAVTSRSRNPALPGVPTMAENGLAQVGYHPDTWYGFLAAPGTPVEVVNRLNNVINESLRSEETGAALARLGIEAKLTTPQQFVAFLAEEKQKWPPLLKQAGLKPE